MSYTRREDFAQIKAELLAAGLGPGALLQVKRKTHFWILDSRPVKLQRMHDSDGRLVKEIIHGELPNLLAVEEGDHLLFLGHVSAPSVVDNLGNIVATEYRILTFLHEKTVLWWWLESIVGGAAMLADSFKMTR